MVIASQYLIVNCLVQNIKKGSRGRWAEAVSFVIHDEVRWSRPFPTAENALRPGFPRTGGLAGVTASGSFQHTSSSREFLTGRRPAI